MRQDQSVRVSFMEKILKIGIIGCGGIANGKHMPALQKVDGVEMVAFCDIIKEKAEKASKEAVKEAEGLKEKAEKAIKQAKLDKKAAEIKDKAEDSAETAIGKVKETAKVVAEKAGEITGTVKKEIEKRS